MAWVGCAKGPPAAPGSNYVFDGDQVRRTQAVLVDLAQASPKSPSVALDLLPREAVRWSTLEDAINHAVGVSELEMAVIDSRVLSPVEQRFYLIDPNGFPAAVTVRRTDVAPFVEVDVLAGPLPTTGIAHSRAADIKSRTLVAIAHYATIRRLAPYQETMNTGQIADSVVHTESKTP